VSKTENSLFEGKPALFLTSGGAYPIHENACAKGTNLKAKALSSELNFSNLLKI
jgi:hypothetical protein